MFNEISHPYSVYIKRIWKRSYYLRYPLFRFESYLRNTKQYAEIDNNKSNLLNIQCGLSAGRLHSWSTFISLYINGLPNCLGKCNARVFVDDITLFYSSKDPLDVQNTMHNEF